MGRADEGTGARGEKRSCCGGEEDSWVVDVVVGAMMGAWGLGCMCTEGLKQAKARPVQALSCFSARRVS